jgi:hypothetical protein
MPASTRLYGTTGVPGSPGLVLPNTPGAAAAALPATQTIAAAATDTVILNPAMNSSTQALVVNIPPNGPLEQEPFELVASGILEPAQSSTATIKLWSGTSTTVGSDTLLGSSGALTAFTRKTPWSMSAKLQYDSVSGLLAGTIEFVANNVIVARVAISNVITGVNNTNNPVASFVLSAAFGTATAPNTIVVKDFGINH